MNRKPIAIDDFILNPFSQFDKNWFVLTAGDFSTGNFNAMTISWGSIGYIWRRPIIHVVVRPSRHTFQYMENSDTFTVCAFPNKYHDALNIIGSKSGRDCDKILESGLTPITSLVTAAPGYAEAELIIECRKIYWGDVDPQHFLVQNINLNYEQGDFHRSYYGEILQISGEERFSTQTP